MKYYLLVVAAVIAVGFFACDQNSEQESRTAKKDTTANKPEKTPRDKNSDSVAVDDFAVKLNWQAITDEEITSYRVFFIGRSEDDKEYDLISTVKVEDLEDASYPEAIINLSSFLKTADNEDEYCFSVTALNDGGESPRSQSKCILLKKSLL